MRRCCFARPTTRNIRIRTDVNLAAEECARRHDDRRGRETSSLDGLDARYDAIVQDQPRDCALDGSQRLMLFEQLPDGAPI